MKIIYSLYLSIIISGGIYAQNFEWAKQISGPSDDVSFSLTVDSWGNVYTTGFFEATADFDPGPGIYNMTSAGGRDIFISKLDANGNFLWAKQMGGPSADIGHSIVVDAGGNVYTTGEFRETADFDPSTGNPGNYNLISVGNRDIFISKLDSNGNFLWAKSMGGNNWDEGRSINVDNVGNVYTTGSFQGIVDFDPGPATYNIAAAGDWDLFITKLDVNGNFLWAKSMGGNFSVHSHSIALDAGGNVYTTGRFTGTADFDPGAGIYNLTSAGVFDIFISKLDNTGNFLWAKRIGGTSADIGHAIALDAMGNVYITGEFRDTVDFDPSPGVYNLTSAGNADIFISKLDSQGNFLWAKSLGGSSNNNGHSITGDAVGNIYTTGYFMGTADFDPGPGIYNLTSAGLEDIFISKLDANGNFLWAKSIGGTSNDYGRSIAMDVDGNIYTSGWFHGTADFDPGTGIFNLNSAGSGDIFISKLRKCTPPVLNIFATDPPCNGGTGAATVNATGNAPFNYLWSNGQTTQTATGLTAGTHTVTVTDDSSCAAIATVIISQPATIVSNISSTPTNFNTPNCNGSVSINPSGGTPPYNTSWSSGSTTNLCQGWYTVTITDANNCVKTDSVYVNFITGIEELNAAGISIYPNPVNDVLFINSDKGEIGEVKIYDVTGRIIYRELHHNFSAGIDIQFLSPGIYVFNIHEYRVKITKL